MVDFPQADFKPIEGHGPKDNFPFVRSVLFIVLCAAGAFIAGFILARLLPSFILDNLFWRDFWSGPPVTGLFAIIAATIAFIAAMRGLGVTRRNALEQEWWNRAEWALNMAASEISLQRELGLTAIKVLLEGSDKKQDRLLFEVAVAIQEDADKQRMDTTVMRGDNGGEGGDIDGS